MSFKWSILIATTGSRVAQFFAPLVLELEKQVDFLGARGEVEVLGLYDAKGMTIGEKRNILLNSASGEYLSFVDDDDIVHPSYVSQVLDAINLNPGVDLITFDMERQSVGIPNLICKHSIEATGDGHEDGSGGWVSPPSHIMVWKSEVANKAMFPLKNWREDYDWSRQVGKYVSSCINIDRVLYWYRMQIELAQEKGVPWNYHGQPIGK